jgi:hypothetical protein
MEKMENFDSLINQQEPEVDDVIGFMDGVTLTSECTSEPIEQNAMYSGYHSDTMVNNLFCIRSRWQSISLCHQLPW